MFTLKPRFTLICILLFLNYPASAAYTLVYSGNLNGELEPCGCTLEGDFGGIKRQISMIDQLRRQDPDLLLVSSGGLLVAEMPSDRIRSDYILRGMKLLKYDVIGVQARDLAFGVDFLRRYDLPFILSNAPDQAAFAYQKTLQRQSQSFSFYQWSELPTQSLRKDSKAETALAQKQFAKKLASEKNTGTITIVSTNLHLPAAKKILPLNMIDILIIPSRQDKFAEPVKIENTLLLQPGARGMRLGWLQFEIKKQANKTHISHWQARVIPLPKSIPDSPRTKAWYAAYNAALKADYKKQVALRKQRQQGKSPYAGANVCRTCHQPAYKKWAASRHAQAYDDLDAVGKVFDPACIGCHSVGFKQPGGFLDAELTPHLRGVQCESCHGPAQAHVDDAGKTPTGNKQWSRKKICGQCHIGNHSPSFKLETYWPKIAHGQETGE
ncbi:hypothetical protein MNBD_GAMMA24-2487 [hydrothermal vent metagenome]|uniref:Cytochrome c-552/4 domain-containing protein n=1 Tax=hydrothermal vent metagenome TaxID=652676 RepID=A0A3B1B709_9ZZZZ